MEQTIHDIRNKIAVLLNEDPDELLVKLDGKFRERSKYQTLYDTYTDRRRRALAIAQEAIRKNDPSLSDKKIENIALASKQFGDFLSEAGKELEQYHTLENEYWVQSKKLELLIAMLGFAKAETYLTRS